MIIWNNITLSILMTIDARPPLASRALAMVHAAIYDAVNAIDGTHQVYRIRLSAPAPASRAAAGAAAAHAVLLRLFPEQSAVLARTLRDSLAQLPDDDSAKTHGASIGESTGHIIFHWREHDHADDVLPYHPASEEASGVRPSGAAHDQRRDRPGLWKPTPPTLAPAHAPHWPMVVPFALQSGAQFRSTGPPLLTSPEYGGAVNRTRLLGAKASMTRSAAQTAMAHFWEDGAGTVILWNVIAQQFATSHRLSLADSARLFALLNITLADAVISTWDDKYRFTFWRPITAIREADRDGNPLTMADPAWEPLHVTSPEPEHTSAHSAVSGAAARILALFFHTDNIPFDISSIKAPVIHRTFSSLSGAAREAADSRIYAGQHFTFSTTTGLEKGRRIADYIWKREMLLGGGN